MNRPPSCNYRTSSFFFFFPLILPHRYMCLLQRGGYVHVKTWENLADKCVRKCSLVSTGASRLRVRSRFRPPHFPAERMLSKQVLVSGDPHKKCWIENFRDTIFFGGGITVYVKSNILMIDIVEKYLFYFFLFHRINRFLYSGQLKKRRLPFWVLNSSRIETSSTQLLFVVPLRMLMQHLFMWPEMNMLFTFMLHLWTWAPLTIFKCGLTDWIFMWPQCFAFLFIFRTIELRSDHPRRLIFKMTAQKAAFLSFADL